MGGKKTKRQAWQVDQSKVLTASEINSVLVDLKRKSRRSVNTQQNLVVFRLSTCCGLRASEIGGLKLDNLKLDNERPSIRVPKTVAKGQKARVVPLFDSGTLDDLRAWKTARIAQGATGAALVVCSQHKDSLGNPIDRRNLRTRFKACCKVLGKERAGELTIHHGRHSFVSHLLYNGTPVTEVQRAAGHASLSVTTIYSHLLDAPAPKPIFGVAST